MLYSVAFLDSKTMDNILKKAIREEIKNYKNEDGELDNHDVAGCSVQLPAKSKKVKVQQTERRLGSLLNKIRTKYSNTATSSSTSSSKKMKKLQIKYERYDPVRRKYKAVKQSDGGGPRFLDVNSSDIVSFREIREKSSNLYFDQSNCNHFLEHVSECCVTINNVAGQLLDEDENLWSYLTRKGIFVSKTVFILRSRDNDFRISDSSDNENEPLPEAFPKNQNEYPKIDLTVSSKRRICVTCSYTYEGENCLICIQNSEYNDSLQQDRVSDTIISNLAYNEPFAITVQNDQLFPVLDAPTPLYDDDVLEESVGVLLSPPTHDEVRALRVQHFSIPRATDTTTSEIVLPPQSVSVQIIERKEHIINVHRMNIREDLMDAFTGEKIKKSDTIRYRWVDPRGNIEDGMGSGVSRDIYSTFWKEVSDAFLIGVQERVPFVRHDMYILEWKSIGKIILKAYVDTGYFPTVLSKAFVYYCLFGEVADIELVPSFLRYLSSDESKLVKNALEDSDFSFENEDFLDFLDQFNCRTKVSASNVQVLIFELARQELIQKPHIMAATWQESFVELKKEPAFTSLEAINGYYKNMEPTTKKVIALFKDIVPADNAEQDALKFLKRYIRGLEPLMLKRLMKFLTGAEIMIVDVIGVLFTKPEGSFSRRPIAHTCSPCIELPSTYSNFCELREEFCSILQHSDWEVDIV